jgi:hypothetical protein
LREVVKGVVQFLQVLDVHGILQDRESVQVKVIIDEVNVLVHGGWGDGGWGDGGKDFINHGK